MENEEGFVIFEGEQDPRWFDWLQLTVAEKIPFICIRQGIDADTHELFIAVLNDAQELQARRVLDHYPTVKGTWEDWVFVGRGFGAPFAAAELGESRWIFDAKGMGLLLGPFSD